MNQIKNACLLSAVASLVCASSQEAPPAEKCRELRAKAKPILGIIPERMPGGDKDTPALVALGKKLYFDKLLSVNQTISCNSCHLVDPGKGGVDNQPTSEGAFKQRGGRNSPTSLNAGFQFAQFWDGRAPNLKEQAKGPILNPIEMAMPSEAAVLERLGAASGYKDMFAKAFPGEGEKLTYDHLAEAIAAFERTLITHDRFDDFQKGNDAELTPVELKGLDLFLSLGCTSCHNGPVLGGTSYQKVGLLHPYENKTDEGRSKITKDEDDQFKFKVPMLRNIALTHPYFHDGSQKTLEEVVPKMAYMQLDKKLEGDQTDALVAFLRSLTDINLAKTVGTGPGR